MRYPKAKGRLGSSRQGRIFISNDRGESFGVHETVAFIWDQADGGKTIQDITDLLVKELDLAKEFHEQERDNVTMALRGLQKKDLIEFIERD